MNAENTNNNNSLKNQELQIMQIFDRIEENKISREVTTGLSRKSPS